MTIPLHLQVRLLAPAVTLALLATSGMAAAETSSDVAEARQETQIWTTYALSPYLRANDLKVAVDDGKATLTGTVEDDVNKDLAKQIALGVSGIKSVDNRIVVKPDYTPPKRAADDRGYGELIDDATITAAVKSKLLWSKQTDGMVTNVETTAGKVTLSGDADSQKARDHAGRLASNTRGVVAVDNRLVVGAAGSRKGAAPARAAAAGKATPAGRAAPAGAAAQGPAKNSSAGSNISDGWITTKVKSTFMYSSNVDASDIEVSTKGGIVSLSGKVHSGAERALAIELADNVRGVKSVEAKGLTI